MLRSLRITSGTTSLQLAPPSYRRMPPPSRLPGMDLEDVTALAPAASRVRSRGMLRGLVAALAGVVRR